MNNDGQKSNSKLSLFSYHQKYMLQRHPHICNALNIEPGEEMIQSHVAARVNGYIAGFGSPKLFDAESGNWGVSEKLIAYIRKMLIQKAR